MRAPAAQLRPLRRWETGATRARLAAPRARALGRELARLAGSMPVVIVACLIVAAITLVDPSTPTYDPWAWIMWGREIAHFDLVTEGGPSWKPLPILFTVPFSVFGDDTAPYLWLVIARAGGLLACVMTYRIARRLIGGGWYGALAGVFAALALFSSFKFVRDAALGNSEALLAALVLWAFERHLDGRRDHALYLPSPARCCDRRSGRSSACTGSGCGSPSPWLRHAPRGAGRARAGALVPARVVGLGDPFRAGARANNPNPGSAAFAEHPALELISRFRKVVIAPVKLGIIIGVLYALVMWGGHRREGHTLESRQAASRGSLLVAGMTEAGFAGNQRYLIVTTAAVCVFGGSAPPGCSKAWAGSARALRASTPARSPRRQRSSSRWRSSRRSSSRRPTTPKGVGGLRHEAQLWHDLKGLIDRGGRARPDHGVRPASSAARSRSSWWPTSSTSTGSRWARSSRPRPARSSARGRSPMARS